MISPPADYRDSGTRDADMKLMYSYAAEAEPPASSTPRRRHGQGFSFLAAVRMPKQASLVNSAGCCI